jgi:hypothetical protein
LLLWNIVLMVVILGVGWRGCHSQPGWELGCTQSAGKEATRQYWVPRLEPFSVSCYNLIYVVHVFISYIICSQCCGVACLLVCCVASGVLGSTRLRDRDVAIQESMPEFLIGWMLIC